MGSPPPTDAPAPAPQGQGQDAQGGTPIGAVPTPQSVSVVVAIGGTGLPALPSVPSKLGVGGGYTVPPTVPQRDICGFVVGVPRLSFNLSTFLDLFGKLPSVGNFHLPLTFTCDLSKPVAIGAGLGWAAGRQPNGPPDPDDEENAT